MRLQTKRPRIKAFYKRPKVARPLKSQCVRSHDSLDLNIQSNTNQRITWRVSCTKDQYLATGDPSSLVKIYPYEELLSADGTWSSPRRIWSWQITTKYLLDLPISDQLALRLYKISVPKPSTLPTLVRNCDDYLSHPILKSLNILEALAGQKNVVNYRQPSKTIEIGIAELVIDVKDTGSGYIVQPKLRECSRNLDPQEATHLEDLEQFDLIRIYKERVVLFSKDRSKLRLTNISKNLFPTLKILADKKVSIPYSQQSVILMMIDNLAQFLPIVLPPNWRKCVALTDNKPHCALALSAGRELVVRFLVKPLSDREYMRPASGPSVLHFFERFKGEANSQSGGLIYIACRDFACELEQVKNLFKQLNFSQHEIEGIVDRDNWTWRCKDMEESLNFLTRLQTLSQDKLTIAWDAGSQKLKVTSLISPKLEILKGSKEDWFNIEGGVIIDGRRLDLIDLLRAVKQGHSIIEISPHRWVKITESLKEKFTKFVNLVDISHGSAKVGLAHIKSLNDALCGVDVESCPAWDAKVDQIEASIKLSPTPPTYFNDQFRSYQKEGFKWAYKLRFWGMGCCLADDMGLGKTIQALALLESKPGMGPFLVVAPASVTTNWQREIDKFCKRLKAKLYRGKLRDMILKDLSAHDIVITSYQIAHLDNSALCQIKWGTVVIDEAQYIKNALTKRCAFLCKLDAKWRIALTGTPIENNLSELWSIFRFLSPSLLGSWSSFKDRFAVPIEGRQCADAQRELRALIKPYILRRTKLEVLPSLPKRVVKDLVVPLSQDEFQLYEDTRHQFILQMKAIKRQRLEKALCNLSKNGVQNSDARERFQIFAALTKLRLLSCSSAFNTDNSLMQSDLIEESTKINTLLNLLSDLKKEGSKVLVFSQFTSFLRMISRALKRDGFTSLYLDGSTPTEERFNLVDRFQAGEVDAFLISLRAGGTGLNLTAANCVVHMDPWWNPAVEDQASDRAHRIGQSRDVTIYRIIAKDTIEEKVVTLHLRKRALFNEVMQGSNLVASLSNSDLLDLIKESSRIREVAA